MAILLESEVLFIKLKKVARHQCFTDYSGQILRLKILYYYTKLLLLAYC